MGSLESLAELAEHLRGIGLRLVLTSGSFDLVHLGHVKYLAKAKELGDVLIVGVDSDAKIRRRKGEDRPMVPQSERLEMLAHQRPVDVIFLASGGLLMVSGLYARIALRHTAIAPAPAAAERSDQPAPGVAGGVQ